MTALESALEGYFRKRVRGMGAMTIKLAPTVRGIPDRLVIMPKGRFALVELKTDRGRLSEIQKHWHEQLYRLTGVVVVVLYGKVEIDRWVTAQVDAIAPKTRKPRTPASAAR